LKQAYIEEIASICRLDFASLISSNAPKTEKYIQQQMIQLPKKRIAAHY
jgi:hypothetical protein